LKKFYGLLLLVLLLSCSKKVPITITKVEGSPEYENAKLSLDTIYQKDKDNFMFSFKVEDFKLGEQTEKDFDFQLANSEKGQHIHVIINNNPYYAKYTNNFSQSLNTDNNVILAFLSRSYHESVKNGNAYLITQIGESNPIDLSKELLFYSRPKGTYKGESTKKVLLDFYLVNTQISPNGNRVKATIEGTEFLINEWSPYYIEGLPKGEISIKLELIDKYGKTIDTPFNPSERKVILKD
tara:strand:- start:3838 stop:4554 length:717 start_codon:yes stop_codon:yes gene_type:complete